MPVDHVWLSTVMTDPRQLRPFTNDRADSPDKEDAAIETIQRNDAGEPLGPEVFPTVIWGAADRGARVFKKLPDIIYGFGFYAVSAQCADVLRQFDLGKGAIYPVQVLQKDKITPVSDHEWFCINFGNKKKTFIASESKNIRPFPGGRWAEKTIYDGDIAVSAEARNGPDLWIDPQFYKGLFLSAALGAALNKAKCSSGWGLRKCQVVELGEGDHG